NGLPAARSSDTQCLEVTQCDAAGKESFRPIGQTRIDAQVSAPAQRCNFYVGRELLCLLGSGTRECYDSAMGRGEIQGLARPQGGNDLAPNDAKFAEKQKPIKDIVSAKDNAVLPGPANQLQELKVVRKRILVQIKIGQWLSERNLIAHPHQFQAAT